MPRRPDLDWLALSGIIALRRHCLGLTAEGQLRALETYVGKAVPRLLAQAGLWVHAGEGDAGEERKTAVRAALAEVEGRITTVCEPGCSPCE